MINDVNYVIHAAMARFTSAEVQMEIDKLIELPQRRKKNCLEDVIQNNILPDDNSKAVSRNVMVMLSKLPLGRQHGLVGFHDEPQNHADTVMRAYFIDMFQELAEIRESLKDLSPILKSTQKRVGIKVLSYARHHTPLSSTRSRSFFPRMVDDKADGESDSKTRSFLKRLLHIILCLTVPFYQSNNLSKKKVSNRIHQEFQAFYMINGISFRSYINRAMIRCDRLDRSLRNMKDQMKHPNWNVNGLVVGVAFQLRLPRQQMSRWRRDVDYALREVKNVKRMFGILPTHHCWQAIFNIITRQSNFNHYF